MDDKTKLIHTGRRPLQHYGTVNAPIAQTSTRLFPTLKDYIEAEKFKERNEEFPSRGATDNSYGISGSPTHDLLAESLAALEGGDYCWLVPSGLSAITTVLLALVKQGDHILIPDTAYGPTRRFCNKTLKPLGIETEYYDPLVGAGISRLIRTNTALVFLESPGSLTYEIQDVAAITKVARKKNIPTVLDNSWATGLYLKPFTHGVDISVQALTKYVSGHSDILLGSIIANKPYRQAIASAYKNLGVAVDAHQCYLAARGLRTLDIRLEQHQRSALVIAQWLEGQKQVAEVLYPALPGFKQHALWKQYFTGANGLISFVLNKSIVLDKLNNALKNLKLFGIGASWGGFESLILPFDPKTVRTVTAKQWDKRGTCIRIHVGLEAPEALIDDLQSILKRLK